VLILIGLMLFPMFGELLFRVFRPTVTSSPSRLAFAFLQVFVLVVALGAAWIVVPDAWKSLWRWSAIAALASVFWAETAFVFERNCFKIGL